MAALIGWTPEAHADPHVATPEAPHLLPSPVLRSGGRLTVSRTADGERHRTVRLEDWSFDARWTRLSLSDPALPNAGRTMGRSFSPLELLDPLLPGWFGQPVGVLTTALAAMALGGVVVHEYRHGPLQIRHSLRAYFRLSGATLAWRVQF